MNTIEKSAVLPAKNAVRQAVVLAAGVVLFALLTAAGAVVRIPVPGSPVPITLQTLFVLAAGVTLGPRLGALSMVLYLLLGMTGYHVFAIATWGAGTVFGATGGFLLGFVAAQPVIGWIAGRGVASWRGRTAASFAGTAVIFVLGAAWFQVWMGTSLSATVAMAVLPFLPGAVLKGGAVVLLGGKTRRAWERCQRHA